MSSTAARSFDVTTWSKGTRGIISPSATDKPYLENVRLYPDGTLGKRDLWYTSIATLTVANSGTPLVVPLNYQEDTTNTPGFLVLDGLGKAYWGEVDGTGAWNTYNRTGVFTFIGANYPQAQTPQSLWVSYINDWTVLINDTIISVEEDVPPAGAPVIQFTAADFTAAPMNHVNAFQCYGSHIHQGRAFYWGSDNETGTSQLTGNYNRVWYSDPYDFLTFTDGPVQFFDVDGEIQGMYGIGSNLFIWNTKGVYFVLQGRGDPGSGTLNRIGEGPVPPIDYPTVTELDGSFMFLSSGSGSLVRVNSSGVIDESLRYLATDPSYAGLVAAYSAAAADVRRPTASSLHNKAMMVEETNVLHYGNGIWTNETTPIADEYQAFQFMYDDVSGTEVLWVDEGGAIRFHKRDINLVGPAATTIITDASGENIDPLESLYLNCSIKLPRIADPLKQIRIKRIVVDGVMYIGDGQALAEPNYNVRAEIGLLAGVDLTLVDFNSGPAAHITDRTLDPGPVEPKGFRAVHTPSSHELCPYTSFVDVELYDLEHVAIERVTVEYEVSETQVF